LIALCCSAGAAQSLSGQVTANGKPADEAYDSLFVKSSENSPQVAASAPTVSAGAFSITTPVTFPSLDATPIAHEYPEIEVRVVDPQGKPAPAAIVQYIPVLRPGPRNVIGAMQSEVADADGRLRLHVAPGTLLRARFGDWATESPVPTGESGEVTLQLSANATFTLTVKVVDIAGNLIPDSKVQLTGPSNPGTMSYQRTEINGAGFEELNSDMPWQIMVSASNYGQVRRNVIAPSGEPPHHVEMSIILPKADQPVSGVVVDQENNPAPGIGVLVNGPQINSQYVKTDAQGRFEFHVPRGANVNVRLELPRPYTAYAQVVGGKGTDLKFYLPLNMAPAAQP
jgi:hypothetical protein